MVACMFQVKRFYCEADYNFYNHLALTPQPRNISVPPGGGVPWEIKSPGNVTNCPETNKKNCWSTPLRGGGFPGELGGLNISKVREISWTAEKNRYIVVYTTPPPLPNWWGGG